MDFKHYEEIASRVRADIVKAVHKAGSGHPGGSLSAADIVTALYFKEMRIDPQHPRMEGRDKFILSKGHAGPVQYAALAERGYFPVEDMMSLRKLGSHFQGHPNRDKVEGIEMSTGSLGQGFSVSVGMAMAGKMDEAAGKASGRVYALLGDGELQEGLIWEAAMAAAHYKLDNLCGIVDLNGLQIDGATADVMPTEPLDKKWESFGWHVIKADGHDVSAVAAAFEEAKTVRGKPTVILAKTVKGKGVSFMENNAGWHGKAPNDEQYEIAKAELEARLKELEG